MEELYYNIQEECELYEDPLLTCAGARIIPASSFQELAVELAIKDGVKKSSTEIKSIFDEQSKRFAACGGNHAEPSRHAVIRRNANNGWGYIEDLILEK